MFMRRLFIDQYPSNTAEEVVFQEPPIMMILFDGETTMPP